MYVVSRINWFWQLRPHLPVRIRLASSWTLLYSLDQHGISLSTLYQKVKGKGPCILAVKDANDEVCFSTVLVLLSLCATHLYHSMLDFWRVSKWAFKAFAVILRYWRVVMSSCSLDSFSKFLVLTNVMQCLWWPAFYGEQWISATRPRQQLECIRGLEKMSTWSWAKQTLWPSVEGTRYRYIISIVSIIIQTLTYITICSIGTANLDCGCIQTLNAVIPINAQRLIMSL